MEQRYTVTQAAEILGVRASVLRYWEEELELRIGRNEQGHRYYTGNDITLLANIKELKKRGLALRAIKELVPRISRTAPGSTDSKVKLLEDEQPEREKLLEFQKILERLITQELHMKKEGEDQCRDLYQYLFPRHADGFQTAGNVNPTPDTDLAKARADILEETADVITLSYVLAQI